MLDAVRIGPRDPHGKHAAHRMRDDIGLGNPQMVEQRDGIARQRIEVQVACGFGGFAKADLVRHHHAIAGLVQRLDDRRPVARRKISAVQQHHGAAVGLRRRHIHIGHPHLFAVIDQRQHVDGVGVRETFKADAVGLARFGGSSPEAVARGRASRPASGKQRGNQRTVHRKLRQGERHCAYVS